MQASASYLSPSNPEFNEVTAQMKRSTAIFLASIGLGAGIFLLFRSMAGRPRHLHLTTSDLDYPDLSPDDLAAEQLIDLNDAENAQFEPLGLNPQSLERLIENRPYRSKLELVARMILTETEYEAIRDKVAIAKAREPIKVA
jgi:hypothetical protein